MEEHGFVALKSLQPISFYLIGSDFAFVQINSKFLNTALEKFGLVYLQMHSHGRCIILYIPYMFRIELLTYK